MHTFGKYAKYATIAYSHKTNIPNLQTVWIGLYKWHHYHASSPPHYYQYYYFFIFSLEMQNTKELKHMVKWQVSLQLDVGDNKILNECCTVMPIRGGATLEQESHRTSIASSSTQPQTHLSILLLAGIRGLETTFLVLVLLWKWSWSRPQSHEVLVLVSRFGLVVSNRSFVMTSDCLLFC